MAESRFFNDNTWARAVPACTRADMNNEFMAKLVRAREIADTPFVINSAFRTVEHERRQGRAGTSSHTTGRAVDIRCTDSGLRMRIYDALRAVGFNRIGIHSGFIHVDDSPNHPANVLFLY